MLSLYLLFGLRVLTPLSVLQPKLHIITSLIFYIHSLSQAFIALSPKLLRDLHRLISSCVQKYPKLFVYLLFNLLLYFPGYFTKFCNS